MLLMMGFLQTLVVVMSFAAGAPHAPAAAAEDAQFENPLPVTIRGYAGEAMEPFLTRDGAVLIFNNSNTPAEETDLHWAERIDDLTFQYRGKLTGANSPALDAVATVDSNGEIFFVTTRSYESTLATIYRGHLKDGAVSDVAPVSGISRGVRGQIQFDVEVSANGRTLIFADG